MDRIKQWARYFDHHKYPCFITDLDKGALLYGNPDFLALYGLSEEAFGKAYYDVIDQSNIHTEKEFPNWKQQEVFDTESYNKQLNMRFSVHATKLQHDNAIFTEMISVDHDLQANSHFEEAMSRCIEIYNQPADTVVLSFMELLAEFYDCQRAYVYRFDMETKTINCVSQWSDDPKFQMKQDVNAKLDGVFLIDWLEKAHEVGIVMADRTAENFDPNSTIANFMNTFHMENITLCGVENANHKFVGVVGISNRRDSSVFFDRRLITTISRFIAQDLTQEAFDATLFQLHYRDSLTGFYNRAGYSQKMDKMAEQKFESMGVISVNINGLKMINENTGISGGDLHIKTSTQRLKKHFGYLFFRLSGDEFLAIAPDVDKDEFEGKVMDLHNQMHEESNFDFSLGHTWGGRNYDFHKLVQEAEIVMYINKQEYYSNTSRHFESINDSTLSDLLSYLANDEFMVYLQPQVRLKDGSLYGAEALIRRFDKTNEKMVFPDQFIPIYEQKSVIRHVDMFVVKAVCKLLQQWAKDGKAIPISVNLSRVTLMEYGIVDSIVEICDRYLVPHELLVIEVTERVGLIENNVASSLVQNFKDHGFNISLDDFGCAYSNIVTLAQIRVDEVKIDKSLVDNLTTNKSNHILVKNVLTMCNELEGASTLAEGIEDESQARLLHQLGCHLGQGYFYSRPIPVAEFEKKYIHSGRK